MDCTQTEENIRTLSAAIARLAIFRNELLTRPLGKLSELSSALPISATCKNAADALSALTSELVCCGARRVSGNIWHDYILDTVLLTDNVFSCAAASGKADDAVIHAMQLELSALKTLSEADENRFALHNLQLHGTKAKKEFKGCRLRDCLRCVGRRPRCTHAP